METMKIDMAGGAAVIAVMDAVARLKPPINVDGFVPLSENLPSGAAQKPGDVIRYRNGKTVEVLNTDAEGRLVLADALTLAAALQPDAIIDIATLTGACMVALGVDVAGVFSNDQRLADDLVAIGRAQGEPMWQLPLVPPKSLTGHVGVVTAAALSRDAKLALTGGDDKSVRACQRVPARPRFGAAIVHQVRGS